MSELDSGQNALELREVSKTYAHGALKVTALRSISFVIKGGEYVAIMGPSGSGKSTLMNVLGCLDSPSSGTYIFDGVDVSKLDDNALAAIRLRKIGFVFQSFNLLAGTEAIRNVALPLFYAGVATRQRLAIAQRALEEVGLGERARHKPSELSGGEQQRVAIARALINDPALLLADEPTGNLDSKTGADIMTLFAKLNAGGRTIMVVTHDQHIAREAGRVIHLRDGMLVEDTAAERRQGERRMREFTEIVDIN
jgi:putative ABC transport system ATP-binding protein